MSTAHARDSQAAFQFALATPHPLSHQGGQAMQDDIDWTNASSDFGLVKLCREMAALAPAPWRGLRASLPRARAARRCARQRRHLLRHSPLHMHRSCKGAGNLRPPRRLGEQRRRLRPPPPWRLVRPARNGAAALAAILILTGAFSAPLSLLMPIGAALSLAMMTGVVGFDLFTPLCIVASCDGGAHFERRA